MDTNIGTPSGASSGAASYRNRVNANNSIINILDHSGGITTDNATAVSRAADAAEATGDTCPADITGSAGATRAAVSAGAGGSAD